MGQVLRKVHVQRRIKFAPQMECVKVQIITIANHKIRLIITSVISFYLESNCFTLTYCYRFCYFLSLTGCNVNGVAGDGTSTVKGTCPETYQVCASSGMCEGTNYYCCQSQNKAGC